VNDKIGRIVIKDRDALTELFQAARDDVHELFRPFFRDLLSPNKDMFVDLASWDRLVERGEFSDQNGSNRIFFLSMLRPRAFKDAILLGANIADSLVYRRLTRFHGYEFEELGPIKSQLGALPENLGSRLQISFFISKRHPSKALYSRSPRGAAALAARRAARGLSRRRMELARPQDTGDPFVADFEALVPQGSRNGPQRLPLGP
jgi:hypothetical protein